MLAHKGSLWGKYRARYAQMHLMSTVKKMQLWASKIDAQYFDSIEQQTLLAFTRECEMFAYLLQMMYKREASLADHALIGHFKEKNKAFKLADIMTLYAHGAQARDLDSQWRDSQEVINTMEKHLVDFFSQMQPDQYSQEEIIHFYELIALRRNVWVSFFHCQSLMEKLDFNVLKRNRF